MQCINICGNQSISKYTEYHPGCISDLLRHRLNASTGWWCDLSVAKKDWKGVSVHSNAVRMVIFNSSCCLSEVQIAIQHNNQQCFQSIPRVWKRYKFDQVTCSYGEHLAGKVTKGLAWQLSCVVFNENSQKLGDWLPECYHHWHTAQQGSVHQSLGVPSQCLHTRRPSQTTVCN